MGTGVRPNAAQVTAKRNPVAGRLADFGVGAKIYVSVLAIALAALAIGLVSVNRMSELNDGITQMKTRHVDALVQLSTLRGAAGDGASNMFGWAMGQDAASKTASREQLEEADEALAAALARYRELASDSPERLAAAQKVDEEFTFFRNLRNVALFREAPAAGFQMPPAAEVGAAWTRTQENLKAAILELQQVEDAESTEMAADAEETYRDARTQMIIFVAVALLLGLGLATFVCRVIVRQLGSVSTSLAAVAQGDLTVPAEVQVRDELGGMAVAVNTARDSLRDMVGQLTTSSHILGQSTQRLTSATERIGESAQQAAAQADAVSVAAGTVSTNVQTVAAGSDEMGVSIREIAESANEAARVASEAVGVAETTNATVSKLGDSSAEIGNVIKVITSIAEQTNLLALNATIEAARAGEMGKGFAVVASEVKDLAQETARATEDISRRVEAIQSDTTNAVAAIGEISQIIARINDYQLTIASAVEEQTATTGEMSRSVGDAAQGSTEIASTITGVASAAQSTTATLAEASGTANELAGISAELQRVIGRFRI
ncbi:methyl-accepting chemotaxis protein [Actinoplanes aureus]|uniref:Methyl-accepting chemotaxis protein n=1 Tax=Actinoplanes aureus TaxID=2792083 RepID=A0A931G788_9ACTN|nr:methyl-accepting chemotaxis protein [Actinoplanes aureus]MBG0567989.1 methyl-accepting chemotaxis protein [Actinoplanes aureus]